MEDVQVSVESAEGLERRLRVNVPARHIEREVKSRLKSVRQSANIKGFRPGKAPDSVIRQRYGEQVRREVLQDLLQSSYAEAVNREKLQPAGAPRIDAEEITDGSDLVYTAVLEVYPEFQLAGVDGIEIERPEVQIADADIDGMIESLRRQRAAWTAVERASKEGDQVTIDFNGLLDGEPLQGGSGTEVPVVLGAGRMLPDFEQALYGTRSGEVKEFDVSFPADYHAEELRGRTARFTATVREVAEQLLPALDVEFIRTFGIESGELDEFRVSVRKNMEAEGESRGRAEVKRQLFDRLLAANPISVPSALVAREAQVLQSDAMRQMGVRDPQQVPDVDTFRDTAERRVRLGLIVASLIRDNGITVDRARVSDRIDELSAPYDDPAQIRTLYLQNPELMSQIEHAVLEEQVVDWLNERVKSRAKPVPFRELMAL
jgi:trigger factor